ncbi:hypothetical protein BKA93DRAFT_736345 [Sparassis latifolia]|uniref:YCII-related domain-containing protein n=1 Tax=Sparassis crispa TaxID=139825 RepID=A0A401GQC2_9APHY|nr:hypothetical protein SCP_0510030 [Sparassis crispa]GBE83944.1 hypothetical protein SCP_0510030 [Sparassis crispa]
MSTTALPLHKFLVYAPDQTDVGALERRLSVRASHLENATGTARKGLLQTGGPLLSPESIASPTAEKKMVGSLMIFEADNIETVKKIVESDIYYTSGVWDKEKLVILPWIQATFQ